MVQERGGGVGNVFSQVVYMVVEGGHLENIFQELPPSLPWMAPPGTILSPTNNMEGKCKWLC